jgi:hypothetical protein
MRGEIDPRSDEFLEGVVDIGLGMTGAGRMFRRPPNSIGIGGNPLRLGSRKGSVQVNRRTPHFAEIIRPLDTRSGQTGRTITRVSTTPQNTLTMDLEFGVDDLKSLAGREMRREAGLLDPKASGINLSFNEEFLPVKGLDIPTLFELRANGLANVRHNMTNLQPEFVQFSAADKGVKEGLQGLQGSIISMLKKDFGAVLDSPSDAGFTMLRFPKHKLYPEGLPEGDVLRKMFE